MFLHIRVEDSSSSVLDLICQKQLKIRAAPVPQTPDRTPSSLSVLVYGEKYDIGSKTLLGKRGTAQWPCVCPGQCVETWEQTV